MSVRAERPIGSSWHNARPRMTRKVKILCAVPRRASSAGVNPARQLSFQPVAVGAAMEATKSSEPLTQRVACGDSARRQAAALWMTTPLSAASSWQPSPKSEVYIIATSARRRPARCMAKPGVMPGTASICAGQEKTPPILPFTTPTESDQRLRVGRRDAPGPDERSCRRIRPGDDVFGTHNRPTDKDRLKDKLVQRLRKLGYAVEVSVAEPAA